MEKITILLIFYTSIGICQTKDLCDLVFSTKDNFSIIQIFNGKIPEEFNIADTTATWDPQTFYLKDINLKDKDILAEIKNDDHHPYHHKYLFSNISLNNKVSDSEKIMLSKISQGTKSKKIKLKGKNYRTMNKPELTNGFYFLITEPILTESEKFAFLKVIIKSKFNFLEKVMDQYYGDLTFMFEKNENGKWHQIGINKFLML